jgi:hypothetical protein
MKRIEKAASVDLKRNVKVLINKNRRAVFWMSNNVIGRKEDVDKLAIYG